MLGPLPLWTFGIPADISARTEREHGFRHGLDHGDWFLQGQNEPSIASNSDYHTVDLPGLLGMEEYGKA
jgi:hypothetical protein